VKHSIAGKLGTGRATPVIGGLARRSPHQFDGTIDAVRIVPGLLAEHELARESGRWPAAAGVAWRARQPTGENFEWTGSATTAESADPRTRAMADLCHVLLNANEFVYLH
jgi:hypothetical protein